MDIICALLFIIYFYYIFAMCFIFSYKICNDGIIECFKYYVGEIFNKLNLLGKSLLIVVIVLSVPAIVFGLIIYGIISLGTFLFNHKNILYK